MGEESEPTNLKYVTDVIALALGAIAAIISFRIIVYEPNFFFFDVFYYVPDYLVSGILGALTGWLIARMFRKAKPIWRYLGAVIGGVFSFVVLLFFLLLLNFMAWSG